MTYCVGVKLEGVVVDEFDREAQGSGGQGFPPTAGRRLCTPRGGAAEPGPRSATALNVEWRGMVGVGRFELPTSRSRTVRSNQAELHPARCSLEGAFEAA